MKKIRNNVDLNDLEKLGFKKDKYIGYVLKGKKEGNFVKHIASVNVATREVWISIGHETEVLNLLTNLLEND